MIDNIQPHAYVESTHGGIAPHAIPPSTGVPHVILRSIRCELWLSQDQGIQGELFPVLMLAGGRIPVNPDRMDWAVTRDV